MNKQKLGSIVGILVIAAIVLFSPFKREEGDFSKIIRSMGDRQLETSEKITDKAVSNVEGGLVGEHQIDGANWSIPNIIRHLLGVDKE